MNTTELKKMAEAASLTGAQLVNMSVFEFAEAQRLKQQFRQIRPEAILKLLAINAELADALRSMLSLVRHNAPELSGKVLGDAEAALAKAEGGELLAKP